MATIQNTEVIELTTTATNFTFDAYDGVSLYTIYTAAPLTILGTSTIASSGTLNIGLTYRFNYIAEITGGTVTVFGTNIPTHLLDKNCEIVAIYTDAGWVVSLIPNFFESGVVETSDLTVTPGTYVGCKASAAGYVSANVAGVQTLQTINIPANTIITNTSAPFQAIKITAYGNSTAASKDITITITEGATTKVVFANNLQTIYGGWKIEAIVSLTPVGNVWQSEAMINPTSNNPTTWFGNGSNYDCSLDQLVAFKVEETVPAGGLVTLRSLRVEKIIA